MVQQITIRNAASSDIDDIYRLVCDLERKKFDFDEFAFIFEYNSLKRNIFYKVIEIDGMVIGFISLHIQYLLHHCGKVAEIQELIIDEEYRGLNMGKKVIDDIRNIAIKEKCYSLEVSCGFPRERAHRFYQTNGFTRSHFNFTCKL